MVGLGLSLSASMAACKMCDDVESVLDDCLFAVHSGTVVWFHSRSQLSSVTKEPASKPPGFGTRLHYNLAVMIDWLPYNWHTHNRVSSLHYGI